MDDIKQFDEHQKDLKRTLKEIEKWERFENKKSYNAQRARLYRQDNASNKQYMQSYMRDYMKSYRAKKRAEGINIDDKPSALKKLKRVKDKIERIERKLK